jgi:hypothetical protein
MSGKRRPGDLPYFRHLHGSQVALRVMLSGQAPTLQIKA